MEDDYELRLKIEEKHRELSDLHAQAATESSPQIDRAVTLLRAELAQLNFKLMTHYDGDVDDIVARIDALELIVYEEQKNRIQIMWDMLNPTWKQRCFSYFGWFLFIISILQWTIVQIRSVYFESTVTTILAFVITILFWSLAAGLLYIGRRLVK